MQKITEQGETLSAQKIDLRNVSNLLCKMPERQSREAISHLIDTLFESASVKVEGDKNKEVLSNLRKLVSQVEEDLYQPKPRFLDAFFFPNKENVFKIVNYIKSAKKTCYICVFNITNNDLANAILDRHAAGVDVKVISDDECKNNQGSDVQMLADRGVQVRTDSEPSYHMHDKFMVVDNLFVLTGSFNWTFQASNNN